MLDADMTMGPLLTQILISSTGFGLLLFGKKQKRLLFMVAGLALMAVCYAVESTLWQAGSAGVIVTALIAATPRRAD